MDKIIARKRWFFLFSLLITIPGLFFTLATPLSGGAIGLKFSIDYTGGTIWEFRPESPADPLVVQAAVGVDQAGVQRGIDLGRLLTKDVGMDVSQRELPRVSLGPELVGGRADLRDRTV